MNDMTVGMENLPNVFIDKIDLYPVVGPGQAIVTRYRIRMRLCMYDHSPSRAWHAREDVAGLRVKIVFRGLDAADALNNGEDSLYDYNPSLPGVIVIGHDSFSIDEELDGYTKFSTIVETRIPAQGSLNVYVACFIDDFDFGYDLFNKFYGPMAAEKILVGGQINEQSGYFYYPDTNEEYAGPVHGHQGTYMEGSEHSSQTHADLRYVSEEDYKVRIPTFQLGEGYSLAPNLSSDPSQSQDMTSETNPDQVLGPNQDTSAMTTGVPSASSAVAAYENMYHARPQQAQNLLAEINFEIRDAIRRGWF